MLPHEVIAKVPLQFDTGLASGDLLFFPSVVEKHVEGGIEFEIRLCPALQKQCHNPVETTDDALDPFNPPYNPNLFVGYLRNPEFEAEYVALMNKYSIVRDHFLIVTKEFQSQALPLMPEDLVNAYLLVAAADKARQTMFAFYNCGDLSGASQPHKHMQFLKIDDADGPPMEKLARDATLETPGKAFSLSSLPYANHIFRFPRRLSSQPSAQIEETLAQAFLTLLDLAISTIRHCPDYPAGKLSYNVIITLEHMHVIPRRKETHTLKETGERLSVNALGFAGMLVVKSETELEAVKKEGCKDILRAVALESVHDIQVAGTCDL